VYIVGLIQRLITLSTPPARHTTRPSTLWTTRNPLYREN